LRQSRVLLAEDHPETRERVAGMLVGEFEVVGQVCDGKALLSAAGLLDPDLIVLDISMPILSGIDAASRLAMMGSRAKLVFLTVHDDQDYIGEAFSAGAQAYVVKSRLASDLLPAMRVAIAGWHYLSPRGVPGMKG
jgi:DNA-binding NarL/FixJ family response regulator